MSDGSAKPRVRVAAPSRASALPSALPIAAPTRPVPGAAYMRGFESAPMFSGWHPALRESSDEVKQAWRLAVSRTIDSFHNSGFLSASRDKSVAAIIGNMLQLECRPNWKALGWSDTQAAELTGVVEARWSVSADSPRAFDARNQLCLHEQVVQSYLHWMATGEILATLPYFLNPGSRQRTKLRILPAWRLSNQSEEPNLIQGVRVNSVGAPIAYRMKRKTPYGGKEEFELARFDSVGRPIVLHVFEGEPDQVRGISPFAPTLKVVRQFDQATDATLTTLLIQTIFAGMFKSNGTPEQVLDALRSEGEQGQEFVKLLTEKASWYDKTDINLGVHGKLLHGFPGDELQFFRSETPNSNFLPLMRFLQMETASVTALTLEEYTGDYTGATYSSIQMGTAVNWPRVLRRRRYVAAPVYQTAYECWLEEQIETGAIKFPGGVENFLLNRDAVCQANWVGPVKPQADELKTAKAASTLRDIDFPDSYIYGMYGLDRDDVYDELAREKKLREQKGIERTTTAKPDPVGDALVVEETKKD